MRLQAPTSGTAAGGIINASCMLTDQVGDMVYVRGAGAGTTLVARANAAQRSKMPAIGSIISKQGFTDCLVQLGGPVLNIYTGLTAGERYFTGLTGRPTIPSDFPDPGPGERYHIQHIGVAFNTDILALGLSTNMTIRVG